MPNFGTHLSGPIRHTTRFRDQGDRAWFRDLPVGMNDPDFVHHFVDYIKVNDYVTTDYTFSSSGTGGGAIAATSSSAVMTGAALPGQPVLSGANYGVPWSGALILTTGSTAGNYANVQNKVLNWLLDPSIVANNHPAQTSKKLWFETAVWVDTSATDVDAFIGLSETQTNLVGLSQNYVGFRIRNSGNTVNFVSSTANVVTSSTAFAPQGSVTTSIQPNTLVKLGFVFDNSNSINYYVNRNFVGTSGPGTFPTSPLATSLQITTNSANNRTMLVDYFYVCKTR